MKCNSKSKSTNADIYEISQRSLQQDGTDLFYYGAQGAFQMMKACDEIKHNNRQYVRITSNSLSDESYQIMVQAPGTAVLEEDIVANSGCFETSGDTIEELVERLDSKKSLPVDEVKDCKYRISILYASEEQLNSKIQITRKLIMGLKG